MDEDSFVALSPTSRKLLDRIRQSSNSDLPVLVLGEIGTGKSYLGKLLCSLAKAKFPNFTAFDFGASETDSEAKEAFSTLSSLNGHTILLENVSKLDPALQVQLLQKIRADKGKNRYIFSEDLNIKEKVSNGKLLESLLIEIQTLQLNLPALRERKEDIAPFVRFFLADVGKKYGRRNIKISDKLGKFLLEYDYPGNLHQLRNLIEGMVSLHNVKTLDTKHLPPELFETRYKTEIKLEVRTGIPLKDYEREIIRRNLVLVNGNREKAARILGISERTIYRKITEFDLNDPKPE
ncbi:Fis family transcriptional regulator [Leptospira perolatii]|uniref:Fis family transcriptional regulator n=2 Tax=Leptospira perolatii TaxID=2023191 RepID=A0A2M9ZSW2_9LEPT|nr:sigma 54-interacting transcriptional regulator [Leptospira perolatii]PJZ71553.1 Fis family transcriptional regulator [Leptospira perolatii]PJZ75170.1 Fis family transcriptional regulator [Leptospira perolatii]